MAATVPRQSFNLRKHKDANVATLKQLWKELVPLILTAFSDPAEIRENVAIYFGEPPWDFLEDDRTLAPAVLWEEAPRVAIKSTDYAFNHPGPNHFNLRVDLSEIPGLRKGGYYQFELPTDGAFVQQLESTFANNIRLQGYSNLRVLYGRTVRKNRRAQVTRPRVGETLLLERHKIPEQPLIEALVLQVHNAPNTGQLYLVVSFADDTFAHP